jgi:hypothetical protein
MLVAGGTRAVAVLLRPGLAGVRAIAVAAPGHGVAGLQEMGRPALDRGSSGWLGPRPAQGGELTAHGRRGLRRVAQWTEEVEGSTERFSPMAEDDGSSRKRQRTEEAAGSGFMRRLRSDDERTTTSGDGRAAWPRKAVVVAACSGGALGQRRGVEDRRRGFGSARVFSWRWPLGERAWKAAA